jgi:FkbM family methyltransferase
VERLKAAISPFVPYRVKRALLATVLFDRPSKLVLGSFGPFEIAFRRGTADEAVIKESFDRDTLLAGVPEYKPASDHIVIDVGAHIGAFSLLASSKVPQGKVFAIEASADTFDFLRINVALNRTTNISAHRLALLDKRGTCTLHHDAGNWGHSVVKRLSHRSELVECCSLAEFMDDNAIRHCDFIKLNCEGAEFPILLSASGNTLRKFSFMLVLYHCDLWRANTEADLVEHLRANGFECAIRNRTEKRGWIIAQNAGL